MSAPSTIAELANSIPQSITVLEKLGIDYCCHGQQTIEQACKHNGITPDELLALIDKSARPSPADGPDWASAPMSAIITFIVGTHHTYTRDMIAMLPGLAARVHQVHGANHSELQRVEVLVREISEELFPHMLKEEQVLFPYINSIEEAAKRGGEPAIPFFGTAKNPIRMMMLEHEAVGEKLVEIRTITENFALPPEACTKYRTLFAKLEELEQDLHRHIHIENNVLFPRAISMEDQTRKTAIPAAMLADHCCTS